MIEAKDLTVGMIVKYKNTNETILAKVMKIDTDNKIIYFKDVDYFKWKEPFDMIPEAVIKITNLKGDL